MRTRRALTPHDAEGKTGQQSFVELYQPSGPDQWLCLDLPDRRESAVTVSAQFFLTALTKLQVGSDPPLIRV